ncbi:dienelactone hydrolase family protein [Aliidiomarina quisquiliarum]|uniref:dienelactone hydrolase family protein n=1 Tax=Aliidiomarina quisquiliarum TaxID=2938947 RepID=UPI00208ED9A8|nr:dienelactone hydrolase family protein [Aliidiomarina quisquiliarum]MCO4320051.1 dienelactone hydrolase family protein [Aliidiomarina quisquiliarum]
MNGQMIEFNSNGTQSQGYLATPAAGKGPAIIVLQEWWGLVDHIKDICDRFAAAGFVALAPDLYHGESTTSPDNAGRLMMAINIERTENDLRGAVNYLLEHEATTGNKVGTVGFCMGGQLSLYAACANDKVGACVNFYGIHPDVKPNLATLQAPVLGFFAENDSSVPPAAARQLESDLKAAGKEVEIHIYPGVDHAFFNNTRPEVFHQESAQDAWAKMLSFFQTELN